MTDNYSEVLFPKVRPLKQHTPSFSASHSTAANDAPSNSNNPTLPFNPLPASANMTDLTAASDGIVNARTQSPSSPSSASASLSASSSASSSTQLSSSSSSWSLPGVSLFSSNSLRFLSAAGVMLLGAFGAAAFVLESRHRVQLNVRREEIEKLAKLGKFAWKEEINSQDNLHLTLPERVARYPCDYRLFTNRAYCSYLLRRYNDALSDANRSLQLESQSNAAASLCRAHCLLTLGRVAESAVEYECCLEMKDSWKVLQKAQHGLKTAIKQLDILANARDTRIQMRKQHPQQSTKNQNHNENEQFQADNANLMNGNLTRAQKNALISRGLLYNAKQPAEAAEDDNDDEEEENNKQDEGEHKEQDDVNEKETELVKQDIDKNTNIPQADLAPMKTKKVEFADLKDGAIQSSVPPREDQLLPVLTETLQQQNGETPLSNANGNGHQISDGGPHASHNLSVNGTSKPSDTTTEVSSADISSANAAHSKHLSSQPQPAETASEESRRQMKSVRHRKESSRGDGHSFIVNDRERAESKSLLPPIAVHTDHSLHSDFEHDDHDVRRDSEDSELYRANRTPSTSRSSNSSHSHSYTPTRPHQQQVSPQRARPGPLIRYQSEESQELLRRAKEVLAKYNLADDLSNSESESDDGYENGVPPSISVSYSGTGSSLYDRSPPPLATNSTLANSFDNFQAHNAHTILINPNANGHDSNGNTADHHERPSPPPSAVQPIPFDVKAIRHAGDDNLNGISSKQPISSAGYLESNRPASGSAADR